MGGIEHVARSIGAVLHERLPWQRKTQRENLALLVATMLSERSANLMALAAALPRQPGRIDMRYQWIVRVLANPLIACDAVMLPFACPVSFADIPPPVGVADIPPGDCLRQWDRLRRWCWRGRRPERGPENGWT